MSQTKYYNKCINIKTTLKLNIKICTFNNVIHLTLSSFLVTLIMKIYLPPLWVPQSPFIHYHYNHRHYYIVANTTVVNIIIITIVAFYRNHCCHCHKYYYFFDCCYHHHYYYRYLHFHCYYHCCHNYLFEGDEGWNMKEDNR